MAMKWPESLSLVRHDVSAYNILKKAKDGDPLYQAFKKSYESEPESETSRKLALEVQDMFSLKVGDHDTPLASDTDRNTVLVGKKLRELVKTPDIIFVSPYLRTQQTLKKLTVGWPELKDVETKEEGRIREQDHGLTLIYNDWRVFNVLHPEQKKLRDIQGEYWYRYPQGENIEDVRERLRSWQGALTRDYAEKNVLAVTHHLTILSLRANLERLDATEFLRLDSEEKPINNGVTIYRGDSNMGSDGKLVLDAYNLNLYNSNL